MAQEILIYILLALASAYLAFRIYGNIKKKSACDKCAIMDVAKKANGLK
jgi:hypothetical protein